MTDEKKAKLIERTRKLFAMSQDAGSPNEAEIAMRRVTALMDEHGITMEDIRNEKQKFKQAYGKSWSQMPEWYKALAEATACITDTKAGTFRLDNETTLIFRGIDGDSEVAIMMQDYLMSCIERGAKKYKKTDEYLYKSESVSPKALLNDYRFGFALRMLGRARQIQKSRQIPDPLSDGQALVVVKQDLIERHYGEMREAKAPPKKRAMDRDAYTRGTMDANAVSLAAQVTHEDEQEKIDDEAGRVS